MAYGRWSTGTPHASVSTAPVTAHPNTVRSGADVAQRGRRNVHAPTRPTVHCSRGGRVGVGHVGSVWRETYASGVYVPIDRTVIGVLDPPFFHVFMLKNPSAIRITPEPPPIMSDFMLPAAGSRREQAFKQMQAAGDAARRLHAPLAHQRVRQGRSVAEGGGCGRWTRRGAFTPRVVTPHPTCTPTCTRPHGRPLIITHVIVRVCRTTHPP